jgi:hypothetical protein
MDEDSEKRKRRRRNCWEEWQRELARRRERRSDPAGKVMLQLLLLLAALAAAFEHNPAPSFQFSRFRRDRYQPPPGYPLGRAAWARERGLEPEPEPEETPATPTPRLRPQPRPLPDCSWSRLVKDLNRRPTRERARALIEERVPAEAHGWLRATIDAEDWQTLRGLGRGADAETIRGRALVAAKFAPVLEPEPEPEADAAPGMK